MYRIYDKEKKCWVRENIFLAPNEDMVMLTKGLFGRKKLSLVPSSRFIFQRDTNLLDKNNVLIYEGDIVQSTDANYIGIVTYIQEATAYVILDYHDYKYYLLGYSSLEEGRSDIIEVIGNVFDNKDMLPSNYDENDV